MQTSSFGAAPKLPTPIMSSILAIAVSILATACNSDAPTAARSLAIPASHSADVSVTSEQSLYSQPGYQFGHFVDRTTFRIADDFIVPAGPNWIVTKVMLVGRNTGINIDVDIASPDVSGNPGTALYTFTAALTDPTSDPCCAGAVRDYAFDVGPFVLFPGRYYLVVRGTNFTPASANSLTGAPLIGALFATDNWHGLDIFDMAFSILGSLETPQSVAATLDATIDGFNLDLGIETSLRAKVKAAMKALDANDKAAACSSLQDLISAANAQSGKKLTPQQATDIVAGATKLRGMIGC